ncbi:MAG: PEFG-CTERM sorting domain-containing protein [Thaumarchaeota archaeon]|nr:MAG: PEFG-CTERM sorting domain-containing protein [Nitrososphaerota archaeon]
MRYVLVLTILCVVISVFFASSFEQVSSPSQPTAPAITVSTDKSSYLPGDTIVISGSVKYVVKNTQLSIQIFDPINNLVHVDQIDVSEDGKYTDSIKAVGTYWKASGSYTVKVQYALPGVTAQATFTFQSSISPVRGVFYVKEPDSQQTFGVNYTITGGTVKDMTIDVESISLIVSVNSTTDGTVTLQIPRVLVDAKTNSGQDDAFLIVIDGSMCNPNAQSPCLLSESSNSGYRNLTIQFYQGDQDIEIIGTQIVPEFGPIAALVLAIAIISIIAVSAKTGLRFIPKY